MMTELKTIIKGSYDLREMKQYLTGKSSFESELNYHLISGFSIHNEHTEIMKRSNKETLSKYRDVINKIPFIDKQAFATDFLSGYHDVYIYSTLIDYTQGLYRYKDTDFVIPYGHLHFDITDKANWGQYTDAPVKRRINRYDLEWFRDCFTFHGPISAEDFSKNISWLCRQVPKGKLLIILNASEAIQRRRKENKRWEHHKKMNATLDKTIKDMPGTFICDVRQFLTTSDAHTYTIRHYRKKAYFLIAMEVYRIINRKYPDAYSKHHYKISLIKYITGSALDFLRKKLQAGWFFRTAIDTLC